MAKLNPNESIRQAAATKQNETQRAARKAMLEAKRAGKKVVAQKDDQKKAKKNNSKNFMKNIISNLNEVSEQDRKEHEDFLNLLKTERQ